MRIFRRAPDLSHSEVPEELIDKKEILDEIYTIVGKRFMNLEKIQQYLISIINEEQLGESLPLLQHAIMSLKSAPRGLSIAEDLLVASIRSIETIDVQEALDFGNQFLPEFPVVMALKAMVIYELRLGNDVGAQRLLDSIPHSPWSEQIQKRISRLANINCRILSEESAKSKFFPILKPSDRTQNSPEITAACLFDRFTFDCFAKEINLIPVFKKNWELILSNPDIQFFIAESIWSGHTGDWKFAMSSFDTAAGRELKKMLNYCNDRQIKTVFWNKEDPVNYDSFIDVAKYFDIIFTSDENSISRYVSDCGHDRVFSLPFAAQPMIHNPIRNRLPEHEICFAGSWYFRDHGNRKKDTELLIDAALKHGLHIYDRFHGTEDRNRFPEKYADYIRGSLSYEEVCMAYRVYKIFLNVNSVADSPTMFSRRVFEIMASSTAVVSTPSLGMEQMLGNQLSVVDSLVTAKREIIRLIDGDVERMIMAHQGYREVMKNHTYSHRMNRILSEVGIETEVSNPSLISCICVSNRPHLLEDIIEKFDSQDYHFKELIVLMESDDSQFADIKKKIVNRPEIILERATEEEVLGSLFNRGVQCSNGEYIAKWDDDDLYGPNYLSDSILPFSYSDASVVGKFESFMYHEGTDATYLRFSGNRTRYGDLVIGPTIVCRRSLLDEIPFPDLSVGEDTEFLSRVTDAGHAIYASDPYNFVYMRSSNLGEHTWKAKDEDLLRNSEKVCDGLSTDDIFV